MTSDRPREGPMWTLVLVGLMVATGSLLVWRFFRATERDMIRGAIERMQARPIGSFRLTDQSGRPFGSAELAGKVWIADFIFTHCANTCPMMSATMEKLRKELPGVTFVSFSVDPPRDTPETLSAYAEKYGGAGSDWHLLTGDKAAIYELATKRLRVAVADAEPGDPNVIPHSERFFLIDGEGNARGSYTFNSDADLETLRADARRLAEPKKGG